jgi:hypothetical protein
LKWNRRDLIKVVVERLRKTTITGVANKRLTVHLPNRSIEFYNFIILHGLSDVIPIMSVVT